MQGLGLVVGGGFAAALLSVGALVAIDPRGVQLNFVDAFVQLKEPKKDEGQDAKLQWDELTELRKEARRGEATIEEYSAARRAAKADRDMQKSITVPKIDFQF